VATIGVEVVELKVGSGRHERVPVLRVPRARPAADAGTAAELRSCGWRLTNARAVREKA